MTMAADRVTGSLSQQGLEGTFTSTACSCNIIEQISVPSTGLFFDGSRRKMRSDQSTDCVSVKRLHGYTFSAHLSFQRYLEYLRGRAGTQCPYQAEKTRNSHWHPVCSLSRSKSHVLTYSFNQGRILYRSSG